MSEIHETIEKAHEGALAEGFNKRIALVIAVLALFLSFSETLGKSAQTEAIDGQCQILRHLGVLPGQGHPSDGGQCGRRSDDASWRKRDRRCDQSRDRKANRDVAPNRGTLRVGPEDWRGPNRKRPNGLPSTVSPRPLASVNGKNSSLASFISESCGTCAFS
jgi:hypothetical protein